MGLLNNTDKDRKGFLNKIILNYSPLILLIIIISIISYYRLLIQIDIGPLSDACDFLLNALYFSGNGVGYYDWTRPTFFPFIVSLVFRFGFISATTIFLIDILFLIFGIIGFYLFLNLHFSKIESFFGGLLFATFPEIVLLSGLGYSDFACGALIIWAFYFMVLGVKKNPKYFILMFPLFMMAFLTRFNAALVIFPIFLYFFMNRDKIKSYKEIIIGLVASILLITPVLTFYWERFGNIFYPFVSTFGTTIRTFSTEYHPYDPNIFYFVERFFTYTGIETIIILLIMFIILLFIIFKNKTNLKGELSGLKLNKFKKITWICLILAVVFMVTFGQVHYLISELIFLVTGILIFSLTKNMDIKHLDLHLFVFAWLMAFFIFNSVYVIKSDRYFILMAPPVAYLLLLGLTVVTSQLPVKFRNKNLKFPIISLILTLLILLSTASLLPAILKDNQEYKYSNEQIALASQWFSKYEPNYRNKNIYSDVWPYLAWFLRTDVKFVPTFKDNQGYFGGVKNATFTQNDSLAFDRYLVENHADYYFCVLDINLTSFKPIKRFGSLIIYQRI